MRITYRTLAAAIQQMTAEQQDCDVTYEDYEGECRAVTLRICGENHDSLDDYHPVLMEFEEDEEGPVVRYTMQQLCDANEIAIL
jgi:hypothetical protein